MLAQIKQVGITYSSQRRLWWVVGLFALIALPNLFLVAVPDRSSSPGMLFLLGMPMLALIPFLVGHAKMQFAHSRARLMSHFLPAHVAVLGGVLLTLLVLYPLGLAQISGGQKLGLLALALAIGAPALWGAQLNRFAPMLVSLIVFYSLLTAWGQNWWIDQAASHQTAHALIAIVCSALVFAWLWRISHLHEEMEEYQNVYQAMLARRTGSEAIEQRRIVATMVGRNRLTSQIGDWWHARLGGYHGGNKFALVRLLRYGFGANPIEVQAFFMLAMFMAIGLFLSKLSFVGQSGGSFGALWFFVMFAILLPGQMAGEMMAQRRPRIAYEMLLPLSRRQLIDGLFAASARNSLVMWTIMNAGLGVLVAITTKQFVFGTSAMFVLMSASTMFVAMGIGLRFSIWPSMAKRFTILWLSWMLLVAPIISWWTTRGEFGDAPFLVMSGIMLAVGVVVIQKARQAWVNLELG